jgi:hypothetical protein
MMYTWVCILVGRSHPLVTLLNGFANLGNFNKSRGHWRFSRRGGWRGWLGDERAWKRRLGWMGRKQNIFTLITKRVPNFRKVRGRAALVMFPWTFSNFVLSTSYWFYQLKNHSWQAKSNKSILLLQVPIRLNIGKFPSYDYLVDCCSKQTCCCFWKPWSQVLESSSCWPSLWKVCIARYGTSWGFPG